MATTIKLYYDLLSQPSRALYILFKINKVPAEYNQISLRKKNHLTPEFKAINRFQKVPCIVDNDFKLSESVAILRYLDEKGFITEKWYPKDLKSRARTDEYLAWHQNNTRPNLSLYFLEKWLLPIVTGRPSNPEKLAAYKENMEQTLDMLENDWLGSTKFLTGNEINVADIFAICEMAQPRMAGYEPGKGRPKLNAWMKNVKIELDPHFSVAHSTANKLASASGIINIVIRIVNFFRNLFRTKK